jgi:hypothetical protein
MSSGLGMNYSIIYNTNNKTKKESLAINYSIASASANGKATYYMFSSVMDGMGRINGKSLIIIPISHHQLYSVLFLNEDDVWCTHTKKTKTCFTH